MSAIIGDPTTRNASERVDAAEEGAWVYITSAPQVWGRSDYRLRFGDGYNGGGTIGLSVTLKFT